MYRHDSELSAAMLLTCCEGGLVATVPLAAVSNDNLAYIYRDIYR